MVYVTTPAKKKPSQVFKTYEGYKSISVFACFQKNKPKTPLQKKKAYSSSAYSIELAISSKMA